MGTVNLLDFSRVGSNPTSFKLETKKIKKINLIDRFRFKNLDFLLIMKRDQIKKTRVRRLKLLNFNLFELSLATKINLNNCYYTYFLKETILLIKRKRHV